MSPTSHATWSERYAHAVMNIYGSPRLVLTRGEGAHVWDDAGNRYLDLLGGIAVNVLGQAHPAVVAAVGEQAATLGHVSNFFATPPQIQLAEKLLQLVPAPGAADLDSARVFLSNSGTEANEAALKIVRSYGNSASPRRTRVLALEGAFHGRSAGPLAVTAKAAYREPFAPLPGGVEFLRFGDVAALEEAMGEDVAGLILEPIQGEVGIRPQPAGYLARARELCDEHGALLVVDEIQSGMGRTGSWMAHHLPEIAGERPVVPDVVTLAKGLGGGMPIGATVALTPAAVQVLAPGAHGTTFGGNPICAAAALAVIGVLESEKLLDRARDTGEYLRGQIAQRAGERVTAVRGHGLLIGFDPARPLAPEVVSALQERGVIANAASPATVRLAPPLNLSRGEADEFLDVLPAALEAAGL